MASQISTPKLGDVVAGRYELTGELGKGGFGMVFKATQIGMNRPVALKVLLPQAASVNTVVERFQREAQLAKNLVHPNTIQLFDFGETDSGCLFIAMEYLEGQTLEDLVKREGPLPMDRVVYIAAQILKSLAEAHEHGIVHRDLKPANIFMRELVGEKDFVKVLDFGIAKALNIDGAEEKQLTQTGSAFGTPSYMPPEQIKGAEMGPYTDLYALGLIMLKMLTGRTVVEGGTPIETAALQLSPTPFTLPEPIARSPLAGILSKALAKRFQERYQSALEMLRDLQQVQGLLRSGVMPALTGPLMSPNTPMSGHHYTGGGEVSVGFSHDAGLSGPMPLPVSNQPKRSNKWLVAVAIFMGITVGVVAYLFIFNQPSQSPPAEASEKPKPEPEPTAPPEPTNPPTLAAVPPPQTPQPPPTPTPTPEPEVTQIAIQSDPDGAFVYDITDLPDVSTTENIEKGKYLGVTTFRHAFEGKSGTRKLAIYKIGFDPLLLDLDLASPKPIAAQLKRPAPPPPDPALLTATPPTDPPAIADNTPTTDDTAKQPDPTTTKTTDKTTDKTTKKTDKTTKKTDKTKDGSTTTKATDKKPDEKKPDEKKPDDKKPTTTIVLPD